MAEKKTKLLVAELEVIANDTPQSDYCREVIKEAALRLTELDRICEFFQAEAAKLAKQLNRRKEKCKAMCQKK